MDSKLLPGGGEATGQFRVMRLLSRLRSRRCGRFEAYQECPAIELPLMKPENSHPEENEIVRIVGQASKNCDTVCRCDLPHILLNPEGLLSSGGGEFPQGSCNSILTTMQNAPAFDGIESQALRRQQTAFCVLSLMVLAVLLVLHTWFAALLGNPSSSVILLLCCSFAAKSVEWYWLWRRRDGISLRTAKLETVISILGLFVLAGLLAVFTDRDEAPYFVLLAIAILRCAYLFSLMQTLLTIGAAIAMMFGWAHHFFVLHPPSRPTEFLETGMVSVIYSVMGLVVWYLVNQLGSKQAKLVEKMSELEVARERLAREEKLAAVGRLASGIAHEIRNPVAMIASSLATARFPNADAEEREEMFAIAAREAKRLENLTSEFLTYARPSSPQRMPVRVSEVLDHVVHITRIQASEASIGVAYEPCGDRMASIDPFQVEGALVNLAINAIAATPPEGRIRIGTRSDSERIIFEIENSGEKIRDNDLKRVSAR